MMNEQIKAGADIMAGDGGYSIGTQEKHDEFVAARNKSIFESKVKEIAIQAKVHMVSEPRLHEFVELIIKECGVALNPMLRDMISRGQAHDTIKQHFGIR